MTYLIVGIIIFFGTAIILDNILQKVYGNTSKKVLIYFIIMYGIIFGMHFIVNNMNKIEKDNKMKETLNELQRAN